MKTKSIPVERFRMRYTFPENVSMQAVAQQIEKIEQSTEWLVERTHPKTHKVITCDIKHSILLMQLEGNELEIEFAVIPTAMPRNEQLLTQVFGLTQEEYVHVRLDKVSVALDEKILQQLGNAPETRLEAQIQT